MTVINNIEIDNIHYERNEIKDAIMNNEPIEEKLHVMVVVSNPCLYAIRYILAKEFINRMKLDDSDVIVYVVELCYGKQKFVLTDPKNKRHLQLRCNEPLWHKENMVNIGVKKLLPDNWKAFAWIDADIEFDNFSWARDTLKILNGCKDVVQLFSHAVDMDKEKKAMRIFGGFGYQYTKKVPYSDGPNFWHPGFAWACTRKAYEKMGGLYENAILGSADNIMALCYIGRGLSGLHNNSTDNYKEDVSNFQERVSGLRLGYVPGVIRHHYHGSKKNRKYMERWRILSDNYYDPYKHITRDTNGIIKHTKEMPIRILVDIYKYFQERNEDEDFEELKIK